MLAKRQRRRKTKADAVWQSNRGDAAEARRQERKTAALRAVRKRKRARSASRRRSRRCRTSSRRSFAASSSGRPTADGWCHEIKFDGYRVQLRVEDGEAVLKTRKGLDWTDKFQPSPRKAARLPDAMIDGEIVALDHNGVPDFSALQAAICRTDKTDNLIFFAFDLLFADGEDLRALPLVERKERLRRCSEARKARRQA